MELTIDSKTQVVCSIHHEKLEATYRLDQNVLYIRPCCECLEASARIEREEAMKVGDAQFQAMEAHRKSHPEDYLILKGVIRP